MNQLLFKGAFCTSIVLSIAALSLSVVNIYKMVMTNQLSSIDEGEQETALTAQLVKTSLLF